LIESFANNMDGEDDSLYDKVKTREEREKVERLSPTFKRRKYRRRPKPDDVPVRRTKPARKTAPQGAGDFQYSDSEYDSDSDSSVDTRNLDAAALAARGFGQGPAAQAQAAPPPAAQAQAPLPRAIHEDLRAAYQRVSEADHAFRVARRIQTQRREAALQAHEDFGAALMNEHPDLVVVKPEPGSGDGGCGGANPTRAAEIARQRRQEAARRASETAEAAAQAIQDFELAKADRDTARVAYEALTDRLAAAHSVDVKPEPGVGGCARTAEESDDDAARNGESVASAKARDMRRRGGGGGGGGSGGGGGGGSGGGWGSGGGDGGCGGCGGCGGD
jgi:hypothetical protein